MSEDTYDRLPPPDLKRCQGMKPNGNAFAHLGKRGGLVRCNEEPICIVYEKWSDSFDVLGCMSMCEACRDDCLAHQKEGEDLYTVVPLHFTVVYCRRLACPDCGRDDELYVDMQTVGHILFDEVIPMDVGWGDDWGLACHLCGWEGLVKKAQIE